MNKKNTLVLAIAGIIILAVGVFMVFKTRDIPTGNNEPKVTSYNECQTAGYTIKVTYPKQCITPTGIIFYENISEKITYIQTTRDIIILDSPRVGETMGKEFIISGKARGQWFFEASFPVVIIGSDGNTITTAIAQAKGDWMTTNLVPFEAKVTITSPYQGAATLILKKDNPSGLQEHDGSISLPIIIK